MRKELTIQEKVKLFGTQGLSYEEWLEWEEYVASHQYLYTA